MIKNGVITLNKIDIQHLTKDYGNGKGVFDISIRIPKGEVYGYLGPNGAGKSTTMRHLMGFSKPDLMGLILYTIGILIFHKKDLPL